MTIERHTEFSDNKNSISMYDNPSGEIPPVPIGQFSHVEITIDYDGKVMTSKKSDMEIDEVKTVASEVGAEITPRSNGEHNSTVIRHKAWMWVGGALATAMGLTAAGIATAFAIEHHRRKNRKFSEQK